MDDRHLSIELLRAVHRGENTPGDLAVIAMSHLVDECPTCRAAFEAWRRESGERAIGANVHEYDDAFERVRRQLSPHEGEGSAEGGQGGGFEARVEKDRAVAEALAAELMAASRRDRLKRLRDFRDDCPPLLLADALIERAKGYLPGQPEESFEAADLARAALQRERADPRGDFSSTFMVKR